MKRLLLVISVALVLTACSSPASQPDAPDFTLELERGGSFTLSAAAKPVYMVFWAEW